MSMTTELVKNLRNKAMACEAFNVVNISKLLNEAADVIEELFAKAAQQNMDKWIPVKERLPESCNVLCQDKYGEMLIGHIYKADLGGEIGLIAESDECVMYDCIAWQPLPPAFEPKNKKFNKYDSPFCNEIEK